MYEIFARLIEERGLSAYKVSKDTGISQATLSDWKRGRCTPKMDKLQKLADYFHVSIDYLMGNEPIKRDPMDDLKFALFGEGEITDEMFEEVKSFAQFVKQKYKRK